VLKDFGITSLTISYFVLNNAYNNNAAVATDGMYGTCCIVFATVQSRSIWRWKQAKPK
jgi:hypothetical protein